MRLRSGRKTVITATSGQSSEHNVADDATHQNRNNIIATANAEEQRFDDSEAAFFRIVPAELRISIYRFVLSGSRVDFACKYEAWLAGGKSRTASISPTQHSNMFLVCRQMYQEVCPIFFDDTCFYLRGFSLGSHGSFTSELACFADKISSFTKNHIKHLRNVELDPVVQDTLALFPNLQTVAMHGGPIIFEPAILDQLHNRATLDNELKIFTLGSTQPIEVIEWLKANNISVVKSFFCLTTENKRLTKQNLFCNYTTDKIFMTSDFWMSAEDGFARVIPQLHTANI